MKYRASFAGFYPADNPKYTCYVMISEPNTSKGFYGGTVSAPVFKEIAGKTFLKTLRILKKKCL
jgi:cell division protein FtsI (penicillin-binding protein 3)